MNDLLPCHDVATVSAAVSPAEKKVRAPHGFWKEKSNVLSAIERIETQLGIEKACVLTIAL